MTEELPPDAARLSPRNDPVAQVIAAGKWGWRTGPLRLANQGDGVEQVGGVGELRVPSGADLPTAGRAPVRGSE
ncbi:hypothetical protein [Streptacidiphilus sp. EB129]|uniref:hypothetical protein n=1 Tax=Streptacidiphilus sp. EB129 TaxID=3156262 RepID=UPI003516F5DF